MERDLSETKRALKTHLTEHYTDNYNGFYHIISKILFSFLNGECEIESKTTYTPILPLNGGDWNIHKSYHIGYTCNFC